MQVGDKGRGLLQQSLLEIASQYESQTAAGADEKPCSAGTPPPQFFHAQAYAHAGSMQAQAMHAARYAQGAGAAQAGAPQALPQHAPQAMVSGGLSEPQAHLAGASAQPGDVLAAQRGWAGPVWYGGGQGARSHAKLSIVCVTLLAGPASDLAPTQPRVSGHARSCPWRLLPQRPLSLPACLGLKPPIVHGHDNLEVPVCRAGYE